MFCLGDWRLLSSCACLHTVLAALAQFTLAPAISNVYYLVSSSLSLSLSLIPSDIEIGLCS